MAADIRPHWIAVDWGTTHMRAYAMGHDGAVLARAQGPGMATLATSGTMGAFEAAFLGAVGQWLGTEPVGIVMCGMVGSRQGWCEAGYLPVPHTLSGLGEAAVSVPAQDGRLAAFIVPGFSQDNPFDVMRGEESQLAGFAADCAQRGVAATGRLCLPGTHAKWVRLEAGRVTHFSTAMTGELFSLITEHSILRHSVAGEGQDDEAFRDSITAAYHDPACLTEALFSVRAEGLLAGENAARARGRISGLLIGAELAGAKLEPGEPVTLIGAPKLCQTYGAALAVLGLDAQVLDGEAMVLKGLGALYRTLKDKGAIAA